VASPPPAQEFRDAREARTDRADTPKTSSAAPAVASGNLEEGWQRVVAEVMGRKALLGSVLQNATPTAIVDGVLLIAVEGNHFHKEQLNTPANRDLINQVLAQHVSGARRFELDASGPPGGGGARNHPAVQAALSVFQGEVVAVRPRALEEGASQ